MKRKFMAMLLTTTLVIAGLTACSTPSGNGGESSATNTKGGSESVKPSESAALASSDSAEKPAEDTKAYKVGITIQSLENSYWAGVFGVVDKLMKEKGWQYNIVSCDDNSAKQIEQIENFITNQVDLIMVHPSDPHALEDYLKQARDAGIKVMCWDDRMTNTDLNWVLDNADLGYTIGKAAADFINKNYSVEKPVDVAVMNYPQTPILLDREQGILKALEENAKDKYKIVASQPALDAQAALSNMETIFQAYPDVKVVCSIGAGGDIGANEAFMTKYNGQVPEDVGIFSADATQQQLEAIQKNEASYASVGFEGSNKKTAEAVVALYEKLLKGETFSDQNLVRPLLVIDASNAAEYLADYK